MKKLSKKPALSSPKARAIADAYIASALGAEAQRYTWHETNYRWQQNDFVVTYIRRLGPYITDDSLAVFLTPQGQVYAFAAHHRNEFDAYQVSDIDEETLGKALELVANGKIEMDDIRILRDDKTGKPYAIWPKIM